MGDGLPSTGDPLSRGIRSMTWEQRWHPLREEWVIIAAHRQNRPWIGETARCGGRRPFRNMSRTATCVPATRGSAGRETLHYATTFVFDNDLPCVGADAPRDLPPPGGHLPQPAGRRRGPGDLLQSHGTISPWPSSTRRRSPGCCESGRNSTANWVKDRTSTTC